MKGMLSYPSNLIKRSRNLKFTPAVMRHDDLYVVEYPKSGITWFSFILANIIVQENDLDAIVNFYNINDFVPDVHFSREISRAAYRRPGHRFIKSHSENNQLYKKIIYIWRDPVDVLKSHYKMAVGMGDCTWSFCRFVKDSKTGAANWERHVSGWLFKSSPVQRMYFVNYENLNDDPVKEVARVIRGIGWLIDDEVVKRAVEASSVSSMKEYEEERFELDTRRKRGISIKPQYRFVKGKFDFNDDDLDIAIDHIRNVTEDSHNLLCGASR
jgi:hypothetical protein